MGQAKDKLKETHRTRNALKAALKSKRGCGPEEVARIAKILDRAALEIMSNPSPPTAS